MGGRLRRWRLFMRLMIEGGAKEGTPGEKNTSGKNELRLYIGENNYDGLCYCTSN